MPCISVILPTRKRNHLLPRALESLFRQTWRDFEIVLVDDNPDDSRVVGCTSLQPLIRRPEVRVLENPRPRNAAVARNIGLREARGEWITYLDDDDAYHPHKLQKQLQCAQDTALPIGLCGLGYNLAGRRRVCQVSRNFFLGDELLLEASADTKAIFHLRNEKVFFNEDFLAAEDIYFFQCLLKHWNVEQVFNVPEPLIEVYPQSGSRVNTNADALWAANNKIHDEFARRYSPKAAAVFVARARLQDCKLRSGGWGRTLYEAASLGLLRGFKDARFIANACLYKIPGLRQRLKS